MSSEWQAGAVVQHGEVWRTVGDTDGQTFSFMYSEDAGNWDYCEHATLLLPAPAVVTTWQMAWEALCGIPGCWSETDDLHGHNHWGMNCGVIDRLGCAYISGHQIESPYFKPQHGVCTDTETLRTAANRLEVLQQWLSACSATILAQSSGSDGNSHGATERHDHSIAPVQGSEGEGR